MPLRFQPRASKPTRSPFATVPLRLVSLAVALALVVTLMQVARSPGVVEKLGLLFGEPAAPAPPAGNAPPPIAPLEAIDAEMLAAVEDNTTFRDEESAAWFHLLSVVRQASDDQLAAASVGELAYAQLLGQPQHYRGRVVRIDGQARRVESLEPAANDVGIDTLYRIIVQPGRDVLRPFTLYCLELPTGWSTGTDFPNEGRMVVDALFFKNWVYNHQLGVDLSPVFVSRSFTPVATVDTLVDRTPRLPAWQMVALAMVAAAAIVLWIAARRPNDSRPRYAPDAADVGAELNTIQLDEARES